MAQTSVATTLKTAIATYPHTAALKDGTVTPAGIAFDFVELSPITRALRRMVRGLEFDVSEMAVTTYLAAREHGKAFTAIPVVVMRDFHHHAIACNTAAGVRQPKDLEGKRVGVRAYTVTTGVWVRGILASEYGVDLDQVTWVIFDEDHVQEYQAPRKVEHAPAGATLEGMLASGDLAAAIGAGPVDSPDVRPLIPDARAAEAAWYRRTGVYPVNHTIVIKDALLAADPALAASVYQAFVAAKERWLPRLRAGVALTSDEEALARTARLVGDDPLPYGLAANRPAFETLIQFSLDQHIITRKLAPEELFANVERAAR